MGTKGLYLPYVFFRSEEKRVLSEAVQQKDTVVATGGGIVLNPENVEKMSATGRMIFAKPPVFSPFSLEGGRTLMK